MFIGFIDVMIVTLILCLYIMKLADLEYNDN